MTAFSGVKMRIIDLSSPIDARAWEPNPITHTIMDPTEGAVHMAEAMREKWGVEFDPAELPEGELLSLDTITLTTHTGTHVDAPSHYGSKPSYGSPRHIDEMNLDWFVGPGILLDISDQPVGAVGAQRLQQAFAEIDHTPREREIVLLRTGADRFLGTPEYFTEFCGIDAEATDMLLDLGVRVIGTDAFSLDAPFAFMIEEYRRTGDKSVLWPAHFVGRRREYCQIERLSNLQALPTPTGFTVSCLPVKIVGAGAGWTRAVAMVDELTLAG